MFNFFKCFMDSGRTVKRACQRQPCSYESWLKPANLASLAYAASALACSANAAASTITNFCKQSSYKCAFIPLQHKYSPLHLVWIINAVTVAFACYWSVKSVLASVAGLGLIAGKMYVPRRFRRVTKSKHVKSAKPPRHTWAFVTYFMFSYGHHSLALYQTPHSTTWHLTVGVSRLRSVHKEVGVLWVQK